MNLILADTSVWADHLRSPSPIMLHLVEQERLLMHPMVIGELCMGNLPNRTVFIRGLHRIDKIDRAQDNEVFQLVEANRLFGTGVGWIDAHLLASVLIADDVRLWTRDRRLNAAAEKLGVSAQPHH